ncbi:hypothetical protein PABG_01574 [Paracoccidioides brasiliensis Pb03]|uniref:MADS-box domain-containing protein n=1 Tax=Paracoccidioides brasiliensis (strain Pb18) TaxID=502780 RepID=C1GAA0_PARBD|nr:uncharacterized protein PADG_04186 [Paracoccidioides brasiliensis Pb18]EEH19255.1 hypothetical protein PABG_01574 [Paracoccidioides brasiliensis Pb03]EEH48102.2 hypothetical protein PADG_04186 [Paracoccidioides brasiliensis Pb18]ODH48120.1 hypothetical protein GX48_05806 [Paracoccidioides brasiliensis]
MGRRKIEIKAITDDRNRSVTFLKRKGGLFKKAHELSVLCSVDVAVIIFGHNKKLYEFSSGDINETLGRYQYYGQPHEHKGPADFPGKQSMDDDDEDESLPEEAPPKTHKTVPQQIQNQPTFQHVNHQPSASPPMPNGVFNPRRGTPQPVISRPPSRNNLQRVGSGLVPQQQRHHATPPPAQNGFTYMPNPSMYNPQTNPNMPQQTPRQGQYPYHAMPQHQPVPQPTPQPPVQHHPHPHPHHTQQRPHPLPVQHPHQSQPQPQPPRNHTPQPPHQPMGQPAQQYIREQQKRQSVSVPPAFPLPERPVHSRSPSQQQPQPQPKTEQTQTPPPKPLPSKSRSIFTPIDDRGSVLAQHFGFGPQSSSPKTDSPPKPEQEPTDSTTNHSVPLAPPPARSATLPAHSQGMHSLSSIPDTSSISRSNSLQMGAKRPRLKVQIPSENSDADSATADSSPRESTGNTAATPARGSADTGHSGVVLPPPSPSTTTLLSAGAQGPPNPFARPPPPAVTASQNNPAYPSNNTNSNNSNNSNGINSSNNNGNAIDTPISALPSRFVSDNLLPSPSSFYPEWGFGRSGPDSNVLPSPLTFPTPVVQSGPGFATVGVDVGSSGLKEVEDGGLMERKRKSSEGVGVGVAEGIATGGKRLKVE